MVDRYVVQARIAKIRQYVSLLKKIRSLADERAFVKGRGVGIGNGRSFAQMASEVTAARSALRRDCVEFSSSQVLRARSRQEVLEDPHFNVLCAFHPPISNHNAVVFVRFVSARSRIAGSNARTCRTVLWAERRRRAASGCGASRAVAGHAAVCRHYLHRSRGRFTAFAAHARGADRSQNPGPSLQGVAARRDARDHPPADDGLPAAGRRAAGDQRPLLSAVSFGRHRRLDDRPRRVRGPRVFGFRVAGAELRDRRRRAGAQHRRAQPRAHRAPRSAKSRRPARTGARDAVERRGRVGADRDRRSANRSGLPRRESIRAGC